MPKSKKLLSSEVKIFYCYYSIFCQFAKTGPEFSKDKVPFPGREYWSSAPYLVKLQSWVKNWPSLPCLGLISFILFFSNCFGLLNFDTFIAFIRSARVRMLNFLILSPIYIAFSKAKSYKSAACSRTYFFRSLINLSFEA